MDFHWDNKKAKKEQPDFFSKFCAAAQPVRRRDGSEDLYATYSRIKENQATPRQLLKVMIYGYMNHRYSSREIESSCRRDINFMFLLEGAPVPDHATIARFRSLHFAQCSERLLAEITNILYEIGEISGKDLFIDGTKIEAASNKYTFVWKKAVTKNMEKLLQKMADLVASCEEKYGIRVIYDGSLSVRSRQIPQP